MRFSRQPNGQVVYHLDGNPRNNDPSNLMLISDGKVNPGPKEKREPKEMILAAAIKGLRDELNAAVITIARQQAEITELQEELDAYRMEDG